MDLLLVYLYAKFREDTGCYFRCSKVSAYSRLRIMNQVVILEEATKYAGREQKKQFSLAT